MSDFKAISQLAYELWEKGGRRDGTAEQNWIEAERILASRTRAPVTAPSKTRLTAKASAKSSPTKASAKPSRKRAPAETPKVGSRDAPGG
jgi:hypothetical protein